LILHLDQVLEQGAGKEKKQAIRSILTAFAGIQDEELTDKIYKNFFEKLTEAYNREEILPQNNATELFAELKKRDILSILNTGYDRATAQSIVDKLGWKEGEDFDGLVTATDVGRNRPEPDMILFAMKRFNLTDASQVVKVGDSAIDIEEGRNAGCGLSIGITTGAHTSSTITNAQPDNIIDDLMEVLPLIS
jgi:phosphonatase-like hydrolase